MNRAAVARLAMATVAMGAGLPALAQQPVLPVWPGVAPGSEAWTQREVEYRSPQQEAMVRNVVRPTLTAFLPERSKAVGTAVIVCPGGGFRFLSWQNEGTAVAQWLQAHGIAAFVLRYRLVDTGATEAEFQKALAALFGAIARRLDPNDKPGDDAIGGKILPLAAEDGRQAIRVVRRRAAEWGIAPDRIGILGFSAGGMVACEAALRHDDASRPNFAAPIYGPPFGEVVAPADAPPLFVLCAADDALAATNSAKLYTAWTTAQKPAELHLYTKGGHGFGMRPRGLPIDHWIERFYDWLGAEGFLLRPGVGAGGSR